MEYELYQIDELCHYGTKGMRWGIRRYQNRDGTLTEAGKKRYAKEMEKLKAEEKMLKNKERTKAKMDKLEELRKSNEERKKNLGEGKPKKEPKPEPPKMEKKSVKDMTDAELAARKARLQMEKDYKDLLKQTRGESASKGKSFVENVLTRSGEAMTEQVLKHFAAKGLNKLIGETKRVKNEETGVWEDVLQEVVFANNKKK